MVRRCFGVLPLLRRRVAVVAVAVAAGAAAAAAVAGTLASRAMDDSFDGTALNARRWSVGAPSGAVTQTNGRLELSMPAAAGQNAASVTSRCTVGGDLDVEVAYVLVSWPERNQNVLILGLPDLAPNTGVNRSSDVEGGQSYNLHVDPSGQGSGFAVTADQQGALRLARQDETLAAYYRSGGEWILLASDVTTTGESHVQLTLVDDRGEATGNRIVAAFDDFRVDAGDVECPLKLVVSRGGRVTSEPEGISCPPECEDSFAEDEQTTLRAAADRGFTFKGWGGACRGKGACVVRFDGAAAVSATFVKPPRCKRGQVSTPARPCRR